MLGVKTTRSSRTKIAFLVTSRSSTAKRTIFTSGCTLHHHIITSDGSKLDTHYGKFHEDEREGGTRKLSAHSTLLY